MQLPQTFEALVAQANDMQLYQKLIIQLNKDWLYSNI